MSKTLILIRHAKSSWNSPGLADHDRPLNPRGKLSAAAIGQWLRAKGYLPDQVISSTSQRTKETLAGLTLHVPVQFTPDLYHASADQMRGVLSGAKGETVLMLGHNPGIAEFAAQLLRTPPNHPRFPVYPTGATLIVRFDVDHWDQVEWRAGEALDFTVPRDLIDK